MGSETLKKSQNIPVLQAVSSPDHPIKAMVGYGLVLVLMMMMTSPVTKQIHGLITKPTDKATPPSPSTALSLSFNQTNLDCMKRGTFNEENEECKYNLNQRQNSVCVS